MKKTLLLLVLSFIATTGLTGCNQEVDSVTKEKLLELESKVKDLESKYLDLSFHQRLEGFEAIAYLTPGQDGYNIVKTKIGILTVSLEDIKPYANGAKVILNFGNPTSATIDGLSAKLEWGSVDKNGVPDNEITKSKEVKFVESLRPGAWTNVSVVLDGVPPKQLGFVRVQEVSHRGIRLRSR